MYYMHTEVVHSNYYHIHVRHRSCPDSHKHEDRLIPLCVHLQLAHNLISTHRQAYSSLLASMTQFATCSWWVLWWPLTFMIYQLLILPFVVHEGRNNSIHIELYCRFSGSQEKICQIREILWCILLLEVACDVYIDNYVEYQGYRHQAACIFIPKQLPRYSSYEIWYSKRYTKSARVYVPASYYHDTIYTNLSSSDVHGGHPKDQHKYSNLRSDLFWDCTWIMHSNNYTTSGQMHRQLIERFILYLGHESCVNPK